MKRGRPPLGLDHVDKLAGEAAEKEQLKTILATLTGEVTVEQACEKLSVGDSRFHELRQQALEGALSGLAPGRPGRPRKKTPEDDPEVRRLLARLAWLEEELEISRLRTEIAMWKPSLLRDPRPPPAEKGGSSPKRRRKKSQKKGRRRSGGGSGT